MSIAIHHSGPWTVAEVLALPDDSHTRHKLLDGVLMLPPSPSFPHQGVSGMRNQARMGPRASVRCATRPPRPLGEVEGGVFAGAPQVHELCSLPAVELGLLTPQASLGLGDGHPFARARPGQVRLELGDHREDVEQEPADRVGRVVHGSTEAEGDPPGGELVGDVAGVGKPCERAGRAW
jgi:hypothetical protein